MSKLAAAKVIFRRIRGRIIAIPATKGQLAGGVVGGGTVGTFSGVASAGPQNRKDAKGLLGGKKVDTKKFVEKLKFKNVHVVTSMSDLNKLPISELNKRRLSFPTMIASQGKNAFATRIQKKDIIIAAPQAGKSVIGHELGHIKDFRKRGKPGFFSTGMLGLLTGKTLDVEKAAWRLSPAKSKKGKKAALRTYKRSQDRARIGFGIGAAGGVALTIITKGKL